MSLFDSEFYPTSKEAWEAMNVDCYGKRVLDPSAGSGHILKYALAAGADTVEGIERNDELRRLLGTKYPVIGSDWFEIQPEDISHIQSIVMNPPFSNADKHILHAWKVAPEGCEIISQCNSETIYEVYSGTRKELRTLVGNYGSVYDCGPVYKNAERTTDVRVSVVRLFKPITTQSADFDEFYFDMPEMTETAGVVRYNELQALVNNYTGALRCFDRFAEIGTELNQICSHVGFGSYIGFNYKVSSSSNRESEISSKEEFAKQLQKRCWKYVFSKFNLEKYMTKGVMADVNKFVESRLNYPFTMKNIFRMVEIIVGTSDSNMQKAIVESVDNFTRHTNENRFNVEGWKTNSGHMLNRKFITGWIAESNYSGTHLKIRDYQSNFERIQDLTKALCFLTGKNFDEFPVINDSSLSDEILAEVIKFREENAEKTGKYNKMALPGTIKNYGCFMPNTWYEWGFFRFKVFKKGTGHFEFLDENDWAKLNLAYGKAKGQVLPEKSFKTKRATKKK